MKYQYLGNTNLQVSVIALGAWGIGGGNLWGDRSVALSEVQSLLDAATDLGINYIDTAPVYGIGRSERMLGEALGGRRKRFVLQTKCSLNWRGEGGVFEYERDGVSVMRDLSKDALRKDVEDSLQRLKTDYLDVVVVHRQSKQTPVEETMGELQRLIGEGKVRAVGISNSTPEDLLAYECCFGHVAVVQEKFSMLHQRQGELFFPVCKQQGTTFQTYGSLEEGALTGMDFYQKEYGPEDIRSRMSLCKEPIKSQMVEMLNGWGPLCEKYACSISNLVQAWTLGQFEEINLLTGFRRVCTMQDTVKALDIRLEQEDIQQMERDVQRIQNWMDGRKA